MGMQRQIQHDPCLVQNLLYLFINVLGTCRHKHVHFTDGEAEARWGHTPGSAKVLNGTPTFFFQVQCLAFSLIYCHDKDETQRGFGWPKGKHSRCLKTLRLAFDLLLTSQCISFLFLIQVFSTMYTQLWSQSGLNDTLQEWLKCSLKTFLFRLYFEVIQCGERVWAFLKQLLSEL